MLERYGLPSPTRRAERPLIGMISRMVDQKGLDLIAALADELPTLDATFVVLGTGEPRYQDFWRASPRDHPDRIGARIGFDEGLAHLIEGGADMFLMPSRFEPCGLNQMYSLRYGTVPVVRRVGGLADTVFDYDAATGTGCDRVRVRRVHAAGAAGDASPGAGVFKDRQAWRASAGGRDAAGSFVGPFSPGVRQNILSGRQRRTLRETKWNGSGQRADLYGRQLRRVGASGRGRRCWWISGPNGAARANGWARRSTRWPPITPAR